MKKTKVIHVNGQAISKNRTKMKAGSGPLAPVLTTKFKSGGKAQTGNTMVIKAKGVEVARVVYRPETPLKSGAVAWIETDHDVEVVEEQKIVAAQPNSIVNSFLRMLVDQYGGELKELLSEKG